MFMALCILSSANAAKWVWIYSDDYRSVWVDNNSISRGSYSSGYDFKAFIKFTYSKAGRQNTISNWKGERPRGLNNLSHSVLLCYFKKYNGIKYWDSTIQTYYDQNGNIIKEYKQDSIDWQTIKPDTIGEEMYDNIYARARGK